MEQLALAEGKGSQWSLSGARGQPPGDAPIALIFIICIMCMIGFTTSVPGRGIAVMLPLL